MPDRSANKPPLFSPYGEGNQAPPKQYSGGLVANLAGYVEELKKVNEELRQARRAALNLMEDAVLSQEALRQSEESYRTLFNSIDEGFYLADVIFDEDNRPVDIFYHEENPSAVRIYGRSLKGKKLTEVSPDVEGYWYEILGAVALTGASKRLERYAQVDRKWFDFYATRIGDESSRQIALIFQDVTDFKNAREQLEQSRDLLQSVFDASHNGLSVLQSVRNEEGAIVDMRYLFANEATKRTNNRYDLEGKMYSEVHAGFKGTDYFDVVKQVVETGEPHHYQLHYHFEHLDNWFNITTVKLADGVVISFEDISEIKKAEIVQRETEERKAFLLQLSDALRSLTHPDEIQAAAAHTVMTYFGADRCYYSEIENDTAIIRRDAAKESLPSVAASYPLSNMPILKAVLDAGQPVVIHDANATDRVDESLRRLCLQLQILSYVGVPIIKHGRPAGILCLTQCAPRTWTATEVELMEEIAERVWGTVERAKAEEALRQSEEKYRSLFAKMDEGFGIAEVIFDEKGSPVDYRLLEINEQFEKLTGAPRELLLSGKTFLEILPGQKNTDRYKFCHQVALTGVPVRFEDYSEIFGRWFDMNIFRPNPSNKTQIAVLFSNVTERKRKEANLQFLSEVTAQFSMLSSADEIMQRVGEKIGAYTKVGSCNFIDINEAAEKEITVRHSWHRPDFPVFPQAFRTADYLSEEFERANRAGEIIVVCNTQTDIRTNTLGYDALKINAFITVPFFHAGERKYLLAVSSPEPRDWRADEIELFQELANVIFPRLEQVRAIEALRESEARFRLMADSVPLSIWITDAAGRAEFLNKHWCDYAGVSFEPTTAATIAADFLHPDDAPAVMAAFAAAMQAGEGFEIEQRNRSASGEYRWFLNRAEPYRDPRSNAVIKWFGVGVDIHDRKLAEKALEESEERLRTLADAVPQIIWSNDANGKANYFNQRWYEYTGLNYEQSAGPGWQVIVHPQDAPASAEKWKQALAAGAVFDTEYRLRNAAGDYRWFIGRNVPLKDETGKIAGWFGTATDIEDLKKADEALSRSEARLRVTMESATDYAIITMDTERRMEKWSSGASKIFGYTEAEVIGQTADIIFTEEDRKEGVPQKEMETARDTGRAANERWHQSKNGSRFFLSGVMRPIFNPKLSGYVKVARDVTEQKAAEETLRMLEERYRIALQSAEMAAWDWRVVDNEVTWNEQHFRLFGLAPSSQKIDAGFFLQFIHEADRRRVSEELQSALNETGVYQAEFRILRADNNEVRWMTGYGKVVEKNEGRGTRMVGVMYDSTERRLVTEELNRLVAERTTELQRSNEDLRQFAHVISHDLKEPIRKIQTFNNRILDEYAQALPSRAKTYAEKIGTAADRMVSMIEGVLRYSKLGNNEGALDAVNLNEVVQQIVIDLEVMMAQKHAMITKAEMPTITANATLMYQLFYNLILNSLKFSKAEEPSRIAISAEVIKQDDKDFNCIILSDNGIGFEPEFAQDIFKTFTRLHPAEEYEGTGLGLALCKKIVERHGGTIVASGELGKGAVFTIRLPLSND